MKSARGLKSMNWKRVIGLDNLAEEYKFARSESTGYTSAQKDSRSLGWGPPADTARWVGGLEIGVKDGRAASSRPLASHPVNRGKLCPQGTVGALYDRAPRIARSIRCCAGTGNWNG